MQATAKIERKLGTLLVKSQGAPVYPDQQTLRGERIEVGANRSLAHVKLLAKLGNGHAPGLTHQRDDLFPTLLLK
jgi:hypothetical protein